MKRIFLFSAIILCLLFSGCSTKSINSNQAFQQTCNANPVNNNESQEKQCCLKDSLETRIKHIEEICILKDPEQSKDSISDAVSSNTTISPSLSLDLSKKNKIQTDLSYQKNDKSSNGSQTVKSNSNFNVNNIHIENNNSNGNKLFQIKYLKRLGYSYAKLILIVISIAIIIVIISTYGKVYFLILTRKIFKIIRTHKSTTTHNILSPTDEANISDEMFRQLTLAITNKQINNIAITGPYGSGKSSIWRTFYKNSKVAWTKNIVYISLAKFNSQIEKKKTDNELEIEKAIIQQLIYSKKKTDLKYSNISRIRNLDNLGTTLITLPCFLFISLLLPIISETAFNIVDILSQEFDVLDLICLNKTNTAYILFFLLFLYNFIFYVVQKLNKIKISKICLKEIEISLSNGESLFNKYLDEIIYFFEATKCNCVVIEDLDRFDTSLAIFSKLRDLNKILNNYPNTKNENVQFIYFVKDEIFLGTERTKFFDYIIPTVPALSFSNSAKILKDIANNYHFYLDDSFLKNIQKYLNDYRLVKNCINESLIYKNEKRVINIKEKTESQEEDDNIQKKINHKIFSLILYKNLYPKDFSELIENDGILFKCLNDFKYEPTASDKNITDSIDDNYNNIPIKNLLEDHPEAREQLTKYIKKLIYEKNYKEQINEDLITLLLTKGYIEKDYEYYIFKKESVYLDKNEQTFIYNVENNIPESLHLSLNDNHLKNIIEDEINDYQWNSLGVLNNKIIDYILRNSPKAFSYAKKIVRAMYSYDKLQQAKKNQLKHFIPQYFIHCAQEKEKKVELTPIFLAVANFVKKSNDTDINKAKEILFFFFIYSDTKIFLNFLRTNIMGKQQISIPINSFLNEEKDYKECFFKENINNILFVDVLEKNNIQIELSNEICRLLDEKNLYSSGIYRLDMDNLNLILKYKNINTETPKYLTRCMSIKGLKERFNNSIYDLYSNVIQLLKNIDENYTTLKFILSNQKLEDDLKQNLLGNAEESWELYALYCYYVSFDGLLAVKIECCFDEQKNMPISDDLLNDDKVTKKFLRSAISYSSYSTDNISQKIIELFGTHISILNCYEGEEKAISQLSEEKNSILQKYAISHEKDNLNKVMISLMEANPNYFIDNYPEDEYSKDSDFQLMVLETDSNKLEKIQKKFFDKIQSCPDEDNSRRINVYKNISKKLYPISDDFIKFTSKTTIDEIKKAFIEIQKINTQNIDDNTSKKAFRIKFIIEHNHLPQNHWVELLSKKIIDISEKITILIYASHNQNNDSFDNQDMNGYQNLIKKMKIWIDILEDYISNS